MSYNNRNRDTINDLQRAILNLFPVSTTRFSRQKASLSRLRAHSKEYANSYTNLSREHLKAARRDTDRLETMCHWRAELCCYCLLRVVKAQVATVSWSSRQATASP